MQIEQIADIVKSLSKWAKNFKERDPKTHHFSDAHRFRCELAEGLSYHAVFDTFPEKIIAAAAPNEDPKEFKYRKDNYKQITKPYWDKALSATNRMFNKQNYSIEWGDEKVKDFFTYLYPVYGDFQQWFIDNLHPLKYADPNAVAAVTPQFIPIMETEEGYAVDQSVEITPICKIYPGECVFKIVEEFAILKSSEKSLVRYNGRDEYSGLVFYVYDSEYIWKISQTGNRVDYEFEVDIYYTHLWEQKPVFSLKGIPKQNEDEPLFFSHFQSAVPSLDQAAFLNSTAFAVTNKIAFPTRWYFEDDCGTCNGEGWIMDYDLNKKTTCSKCGGNGKKFTFTWGKDYIMPLPDNLTQQDTTQLPTPPLGDHSPSTETIKYLNERSKELCREAFITLNIQITDKATGVTATEVEDDKDEFISLLLKLSREEFDLMQEIIDASCWMRWQKEEIVEVKEPNEFRVRSSADITEEIKTATEAKLPPPYLYKLLQEGIQQRFSTDTVMDDVLRVVALVDPMITTTDTTIQILVSQGIVDKWRETLHYFIYNFIYSELEKNDKFLEGDIDVIKSTLEKMAQDMTVSTGNKADDILNSLKVVK